MKDYGFSGTELKLLTSYLTDRTQYVKYTNYESTIMEILTGGLQGSILGALLFSIYIDDIILFNSKLQFLMYADDNNNKNNNNNNNLYSLHKNMYIYKTLS